MDVSLEGKVALVTGCGPNIGSGIALALARYGAKVAVNDVSKESIDACIARIGRNGGTAMAAQGDVTDEETVKGYVNDVLAAWGKIDILVNNAALLGGRGVLDETAEAFHRAVTVSSMGTFLNTKHVGRSMAERGIKGSIVCISSSNGWNGSAGVCAYAFHKGGVNNFVRGRRWTSPRTASGSTASPRPRRTRTTRNCSPSGRRRAAPRSDCGPARPAASARPRAPTRSGAGRPGSTARATRWSRWAPPARRPTSGTPSRGSAPTTPG